MSRGVGPIELHIQHVRNPRQWMPVGGRIIGAEGPPKVRPCNSLQNMRVPRHIIWIVEIDKTILDRRGVESHGPRGKQDREKKEEAAVDPLSRAWQSAIYIVRNVHRSRKVHRSTEPGESSGSSLGAVMRQRLVASVSAV